MLGLIGWFWQADCVEIKEHVCCGRVFVIIQRGDLMDKAEFTNFYWKYYLHLENEFINTTDFVMLDENNFKTFSIEYQNYY